MLRRVTARVCCYIACTIPAQLTPQRDYNPVRHFAALHVEQSTTHRPLPKLCTTEKHGRGKTLSYLLPIKHETLHHSKSEAQSQRSSQWPSQIPSQVPSPPPGLIPRSSLRPSLNASFEAKFDVKSRPSLRPSEFLVKHTPEQMFKHIMDSYLDAI